MPLPQEARPVDGDALADAGHHVLQHPPSEARDKHVAGGDGRHPRRAAMSASRRNRTASPGRRRSVSAR